MREIWVSSRFLCVICKMFLYMSICENQARPRRTHQLTTPSVYGYPSFKDLLVVRGGDASVSFYGGIIF